MVMVTQFLDALPRLTGRAVAPPPILSIQSLGGASADCNTLVEMDVEPGGTRIGFLNCPDHDHVTVPARTRHLMLMMPPTPGTLVCGNGSLSVVGSQ